MKNPPLLLFFRGRGWVSRLIRWQSNGDYSHMAIQYSRDEIYEAWHSPSGVRNRGLLKDWTDVEAYEIVGMTEEGAERGKEWLLKQVGKKYDFGGVGRFLTRWRKPIDDRWFCSELAFVWSKVCGVPILHRCEPSQASPVVCSFSPLLKRVPAYK